MTPYNDISDFFNFRINQSVLAVVPDLYFGCLNEKRVEGAGQTLRS